MKEMKIRNNRMQTTGLQLHARSPDNAKRLELNKKNTPYIKT